MIDRLRVCYYVTEDVVAVCLTAGVVIWPQHVRTFVYLFPGLSTSVFIVDDRIHLDS